MARDIDEAEGGIFSLLSLLFVGPNSVREFCTLLTNVYKAYHMPRVRGSEKEEAYKKRCNEQGKREYRYNALISWKVNMRGETRRQAILMVVWMLLSLFFTGLFWRQIIIGEARWWAELLIAAGACILFTFARRDWHAVKKVIEAARKAGSDAVKNTPAVRCSDNIPIKDVNRHQK